MLLGLKATAGASGNAERGQKEIPQNTGGSGWDIGGVGLNLPRTQLQSRSCTPAPGCSCFYNPEIPWIPRAVQNTSSQATGTCRTAMVPSKPEHANPDKADAWPKCISTERRAELCSPHMHRELALNAGAAGTQTATQTFRL